MTKRQLQTIETEAAINFATNFLLNGLCAWLIQRHAAVVPTDFWNMVIDTYITCQCICILVTLFMTAAANRYFKSGVFQVVKAGRILADFPKNPILLGILLGALSTFVLAPAFGIFFTILAIQEIPVWSFILFKSLWGGIWGAVICVLTLRRYLDCGR